MPDFCNCGAQLPADARFCHRCGRPQRPEFLAVDEPATPSVPKPAAPPMPPGFHNPVAVRIGLSLAAVVVILFLVPYGLVVWLLSAGFLSVLYYEKKTGQRLTVMSGARMGWITGVLSSAISTIPFTLQFIGLSQPGGAEEFRRGFSSMPIQAQNVDDALKFIRSPAGVLAMLSFLFLTITLSCVAGGALAAKVLGKD